MLTTKRRGAHASSLFCNRGTANKGIGAMPIQHFSRENPLRINKSAAANPTGFKPRYDACVFCREAFEAQSRTVQRMRIERDAEETRESGRRSFEENKETREIQLSMLWFSCTSIGNGN